MTDIPITPNDVVGKVHSTKRFATAQDDFCFGDYMRWTGEPFASNLVLSTERDACAINIADRVFPGQVVEIITTSDGYAARLATPEQA